MLWDRGSWKPKADPHVGLKKGHLSFNLAGERLKGGWDLIRMRGDEKRENWLLIKEADDYALDNDGARQFLEQELSSVATRRSMDEIAVGAPDSRKGGEVGPAVRNLMKKYPDVLLPTLVDTPPTGDGWLHEIKYDGYRALAFAANDEVRLRTRNGNDWTHKFPSISASVAKLRVKSIVLDLEAVVIDREGKTSFQGMQQALGESGNPQSISAYSFDLLYLDGKDWSSRPLLERKNKLASLLKKSRPGSSLRYSEHVIGHAAEIIAKSCSMGLEGIVSKRVDSPYRFGRQKLWLKSKCMKRQEFVIIGYTAARRGARAIGALHLGYNENGELKYAGKVGTGFTLKSAQELYQRLVKIKVDKPIVPALPGNILNSATWVKPQLVCEVTFAEWTQDGHLRQPSFQGLREDKKSQEVVREEPAHVGHRDGIRTATGYRREAVYHEAFGIKISHPDRVVFPDTGMTKAQLADYYAAVSSLVLKDLAGHPVSLLRCPEGTAGGCFYQRSPGTGLGPDVKPFTWKHEGKSYEYLYVESEKGIIEFIQMGAIEMHPWGARVGNIDHPDRLIFDLDPAENVPFEAVKLAARDLRRRLEDRGLTSYLKCTGGKGLHVTVPLVERSTWAEVKTFCATIAQAMVRDVPTAYVATMSKAKRKGKIFVDYFRNDYTATSIADFAVRARPSAPVALPLEWDELDGLHAANQFTTADVLRRLKRVRTDPARHENRQKLPT